ncbi:GIY-YIG nuclease family protein [Amycolatopsis lurida]|uniref:GIY-YIG nuclease family protein n=1 Tax=Amycolatopsis lurida TaxID=31959 RepID=UPI00115FC03D|nr:GIY-YIG nuclease family protein [Amycolatopsis lurida]
MEKERFHTLWLSALRESRGEPDFRDHSEPLISATSVSANTRQPTVGGEQFTLNMTRAVTDQLTEALAAIPARPLVPKELSRISHGPGVYQLFHRDRRVYIGSAPASIEHRLARALRKLSGRRNIDPADVFFNFLKVEEDLDGLSPHHLLLKREKNSGSAPWNQNGFGNLDPGRRRDSADISKQHFDYQYPVNLDYQIPEVVGQWPASEAVRTLKRTLPYGFRYAKSLQTNSQVIDFGTTPPTMNDAMSLLTRNLGPGWQGTALLGHVILYPETRQYPSAQRTYLPLSTADEQR